MKQIKIYRRVSRSQSGFTLLEIMLVVIIIGLLAGFLIYNLTGTREAAFEDIARSMCTGTLSTAIETYYLHTGSYPPNLDALVTSPGGTTGWRGPYLKQMPIDPWKRPYQYAYPGVHNPSSFDVYSMGKDGSAGTGDDVGNWGQTAAAPGT
jgi:general secretion pathway protein G